MTDDLDLASRAALPADLLALLEKFPRAKWPQAPGFHGLASFWLDKHLGFRALLNGLRTDAEAAHDGKLSGERWKQRMSGLGGRLINELVGHHQIEDDAYFPQMLRLERRLARGFDILDRDHHALDAMIAEFVAGANTALGAKDARNAAGRFHTALAPFERQLVRHLEDEEDLIIPVILKHRMG